MNELATLNQDEMTLVKRTLAPDATDDELRLYFYDCLRRGTHPLDKRIHFTKRGGRYVPITSIDFMREKATGTGDYAGQDPAAFKGEPGKPGFEATVVVYRIVQGVRCSWTGTARWTEYFPGERQGMMWTKMPHVMLEKCAEALALRKAFPAQLQGLYAKEEMDQADEKPKPQGSLRDRAMSQVGPQVAQAILQDPPPLPSLTDGECPGIKPEQVKVIEPPMGLRTHPCGPAQAEAERQSPTFTHNTFAVRTTPADGLATTVPVVAEASTPETPPVAAGEEWRYGFVVGLTKAEKLTKKNQPWGTITFKLDGNETVCNWFGFSGDWDFESVHDCLLNADRAVRYVLREPTNPKYLATLEKFAPEPLA